MTLDVAIPQFIPQFCGIAEQAPKAPKMGLSRHFSRQNGPWDALERPKSGDPAVYPAILRDSPAPGIVLFLNRVKPKARQGQVFLVNAEKNDQFAPGSGPPSASWNGAEGAQGARCPLRPHHE